MRLAITVVKSRSYASTVTKLRFEGHKVTSSRPQSYVFVMRKRHFYCVEIAVFEVFLTMFLDKRNSL